MGACVTMTPMRGPARPSRSRVHPRRRHVAAAWRILLICGVLWSGVATDSAWGLASAEGGASVAESDAPECGRREAIATAIAKLDAARATGTPLNELVRQA